jgi:hypothetical protein
VTESSERGYGNADRDDVCMCVVPTRRWCGRSVCGFVLSSLSLSVAVVVFHCA